MSEEAVVGAHLQKAHDRLRVARVLLRADEAEDSISRAYYAVYHAATAALHAVGEASKTHSGTQTRFWLRFVKAGHFPRPMAETYSEAQKMRGEADYDAFTRFDTAAASDLLEDAEAFVGAAEALIRQIRTGEIDARNAE